MACEANPVRRSGAYFRGSEPGLGVLQGRLVTIRDLAFDRR